MPSQMKFKDQTLAYQPFQDVLRKFETVAHSKNISNPFTTHGFEDVLQMPALKDTLIGGLKAQFKGAESYQKAFESCVNHSIQEHANPFTGYMDSDGNPMNFGAEGYGATAITGNYNTWTRLSPVLTAGYLARSRATILEDGVYAYVPSDWVSKPGDAAFESWDGFAGYSCYLYDNYEMRGDPVKQIYANKAITVLWQAGDVSLIRVGDDVGYISTETARTTRIPTQKTQEDGGGGSSGGSSGGGGGGQWTPPAM